MSKWEFPEDFGESKNSNGYLNFESGKNKFRIMSEPIFGQEYWKTIDGKRKPVRVPVGELISAGNLEENKWGNLDMPKEFMAVIVYGYEAKAIQQLVITQKTVQKGIKALVKDEDWGDATEYDITVTKAGEGRDTEYSVMPGAKKKLDKAILDDYAKVDIDLKALLSTPLEKTDETVNPDDIPF